ncbi:hypothetical protein MJ1_0607 [Nanobdella aerobiophila]|uniref:Uncharacterized protein n=1 Tax=Nanobdella aerobiophila TaxID=2586965 RepID=A0A915T069_9ARCH|nr:S-adenosylmethionine decarboxylase [Nanobdella aerobiophila]BBL45754.1 hypothetical protein MJ1_0607 [Nanobdella aerobiophila]
MNNEYKKISIKDVQRLLMTIKLEKNNKYLDKIENFSEELSSIINSKLLYKKIYYFPGDFEGNKDITYTAILSTSHIIISSYTEEDGIYLDIDAGWCSRERLRITKLKEILSRNFKSFQIINIKYLDYDYNEEGFLD